MRKSKQYESHKHHQNIYISRKNRSPTKIKTFITLKDHKDNHSNKPSCCLINLTKNELGKTSTKFPTHVKKVGQNSEFLFGIYRWTLKNPKNQNFEKKWKKIAGNIIIFYMRTKNHNHMKYSSWDTEWDKFFLSFWTLFCPLKPRKPKFWKNEKKDLEISPFWTCATKNNQMMYAYSDVECNRHNFCHFRSFFALLPHYWPWK